MGGASFKVKTELVVIHDGTMTANGVPLYIAANFHLMGDNTGPHISHNTNVVQNYLNEVGKRFWK